MYVFVSNSLFQLSVRFIALGHSFLLLCGDSMCHYTLFIYLLPDDEGLDYFQVVLLFHITYNAAMNILVYVSL